MWHIWKLVFVLLHGQSYVKHGFSVNKELINTNMKEKSLIAQSMFHDKLLSEDSKCYDFVITANLRKSCMLACKHYRNDLEKQKEEHKNMENSFNCKAVVTNLKQSKVGNKRQQIVKELRKSSDTEMLKADENQDPVGWSKAAVFLKAAMQKKKNVLEDLTIAQSKIEADLETKA